MIMPSLHSEIVKEINASRAVGLRKFAVKPS